MGLFDRFRRTKPAEPTTAVATPELAIAADANTLDVTQTFNDKGITFTGSLTGYNYDSILRDKQTNINTLYQLADYWVDADPLFRGSIREVYVPFSMLEDWRLVGGTEQTRAKYQEYFDRIGMDDKLESMFYQAYLNANVYISVQPDGDIVTLPPHLCRIGNVRMNRRPVVEFNCRSVRDDLRRMGQKAYKKFIEDEDLDKRLSGFPPEVAMGLKNGADWVQLNPATTFVWQDIHPDWQRYAIPMVAACLKSFAKKSLISNWEDSLLNLAARGFVHVTYGSPEHQVIPDSKALTRIGNTFAKAMTASGNTALAVTNNFAKAEVIQPQSDKLFDNDKYIGVNSEILSACGISGVVVSGMDNAATFGSSQISTKMVAMRIEETKRRMADLVNEIITIGLNGTKNGLPRSNNSKLPRFMFPTTDLTNNTSFQDKCFELWKEGVLSYETMLTAKGFDYEEEREKKEAETKENVQAVVFVKPGEMPGGGESAPESTEEEPGVRGRPT